MQNYNLKFKITIFFFLVFMIIAGSLYWKLYSQNAILKDTAIQLQNQMAQLQNKEKANLVQQLTPETFKLALLNNSRFRESYCFLDDSIETVMNDPRDKNLFYFISHQNTYLPERIFRYNITYDDTFAMTGYVNLSQGLSLNALIPIYEEKLSIDKEFRLAGIDENKLVFVETDNMDSPGPCFDYLLCEDCKNLEYIDMDSGTPTRNPYVLSVSRKAQALKEYDACIEAEMERRAENDGRNQPPALYNNNELDITTWKKNTYWPELEFFYPSEWQIIDGGTDDGAHIAIGKDLGDDGLPNTFRIFSPSLFKCPLEDPCSITERIPVTANAWRSEEIARIISEGWDYQVELIPSVGNKEGDGFRGTMTSGDVEKVFTEAIVQDKEHVYIIRDVRPKNNGDVMFRKFLSTFHFK